MTSAPDQDIRAFFAIYEPLDLSSSQHYTLCDTCKPFFEQLTHETHPLFPRSSPNNNSDSSIPTKGGRNEVGLTGFRLFRDLKLRLQSGSAQDRSRNCRLCFLLVQCVKSFYTDEERKYRAAEEEINVEEDREYYQDGKFPVMLSDEDFSITGRLGLHFHHVRERAKRNKGLLPSPDLFITLMAPSGRQDDCFTLLARQQNDQIDMDLLKRWIKNCEADQKHPCHRHTQTPLESQPKKEYDILLVNVVSRCIVNASNCSRYATLSYVIGRPGNAWVEACQKLSSSTRPTSLKPFWKIVPKTIQDAIILVEKLGEEYLWVDALAVDQLNLTKKREQIDAMALIYQNAFVNIIAADGTDANHGIYGLPSRPRKIDSHTTEVKPGIKFKLTSRSMSLHDRSFFESEYNHRAWTLQERLLARRNLIFINQTVLYQCGEEQFCEEIIWPTRSIETVSRIHPYFPAKLSNIFEREPKFTRYTTLVQEYTMRKLSDKADVLPAITGLLSALSSTIDTEFFWGLPLSLFDFAILWSPQGPTIRRIGHPSWSWAGWVGPVTWPTGHFYTEQDRVLQSSFLYSAKNKLASWLEHCTWICWWFQDAAGASLKTLQSRSKYQPDEDGDSSQTDKYEFYGFLDSWAQKMGFATSRVRTNAWPEVVELHKLISAEERGNCQMLWKTASMVSKPSHPPLAIQPQLGAGHHSLGALADRVRAEISVLAESEALKKELSKISDELDEHSVHSRSTPHVRADLKPESLEDGYLKRRDEVNKAFEACQKVTNKSARLLRELENLLEPAKLLHFRGGVPYQFLHFYTIVARFKLSFPYTAEEVAPELQHLEKLQGVSDQMRRFCLEGSKGMLCGSIILEKDPWLQRTGQVFDFFLLSGFGGWETQENDWAWAAFMRKTLEQSKHKKDSPEYQKDIEEAHAKTAEFPHFGTGNPRQPCFAMMVQWVDASYAERVAIGKITTSALKWSVDSPAEWKEVVLG